MYNNNKQTILLTGCAGFIGSNFVPYFLEKYPEYNLVNLDLLTYAGDLKNLKECEGNPRYKFIKGDICNRDLVEFIFKEYDIGGVIHFAAESHVDNSIKNPEAFIKTNVNGTFTLIDVAYKYWMRAPFKYRDHFLKTSDLSEAGAALKPKSPEELRGSEELKSLSLKTSDLSEAGAALKPKSPDRGSEVPRFHHISTDEVYGTLSDDPKDLFTEATPYAPNSPYSASKASSDMIVRSYQETYGLNTVITNCSNNYGPKQHDEKLIPTIIRKALNHENIPIYGDGKNVRDWLFVLDHCKGIDLAYHTGKKGNVYNIGGKNERTNLQIVDAICTILDEKVPLNSEPQVSFGQTKSSEPRTSSSQNDSSEPRTSSRQIGKTKELKSYKDLITFVKDRAGHDRRYAIDATKIETKLGWRADENFDSGIVKTVEWYLKKYLK